MASFLCLSMIAIDRCVWICALEFPRWLAKLNEVQLQHRSPTSGAMIPLTQRYTAHCSVFISHLWYTFFLVVSFWHFFTHLRGSRVRQHAVSFSIRHLVPPRYRRCWSLDFSLIVIEVVVVLSSSSLKPKLELLSYPPSGDVGLPSWLIAFRTGHHLLAVRKPP